MDGVGWVGASVGTDISVEWSDEPDSDVKGIDGAGCSVVIDITAVDTVSSTVEVSDRPNSDVEDIS